MSDSPSKQSELFQRLCLAPLTLAPLSFGDIAKDEHYTRNFVFIIANHRDIERFSVKDHLAQRNFNRKRGISPGLSNGQRRCACALGEITPRREGRLGIQLCGVSFWN